MTSKKKIGVTLDETLHLKVKSAAPERGLNVEQAYDQALRNWLGETKDPFAHLSKNEAAVIRWLRGKHDDVDAELVKFIVKKANRAE